MDVSNFTNYPANSNAKANPTSLNNHFKHSPQTDHQTSSKTFQKLTQTPVT